MHKFQEQGNKYCNQKCEMIIDIAFLPKIYNNGTEIPKTLSESDKNMSGRKMLFKDILPK